METAIADIPRLYTAIAEWMSCITFIVILKPRFSRLRMVAISAGVFVWLAFFLVITASVHIGLWLPCMAVAFITMDMMIFCCAKVSFWDSQYYGVIAFVNAECIASVQWQIVNLLFDDVLSWHVLLQLLAVIVIYVPICLLIWHLYHMRMPKNGWLELNNKDKMSAVVMAMVVFGFSNLGFLTVNTPFTGQFSKEIANIRTMVDIAGSAVLYAHFVLCCENMIRMELDAVQNVLHNQYLQYKMSRESVELINYRYHDLKHQIQILRNETDSQKREETLDRMEEEIRFYELQNKTGNSVLDTVLTGKSLYCSKHKITLTTVADGKLLDFMSAMDICSIFGNALDNAIESVIKIPDKEKRLIHVTVAQVKEFVMIRIENYYENPLCVSEGNYLSTKKDAPLHGYGIKSIRHTAANYDGAVYIKASDHWFDLKILLPSKLEKAEGQ